MTKVNKNLIISLDVAAEAAASFLKIYNSAKKELDGLKTSNRKSSEKVIAVALTNRRRYRIRNES